MEDLGFRVLGCRIQGLGLRIWGLGFQALVYMV